MNNRFANRKERIRAVRAFALILEHILDYEIEYFYSIPHSQANEECYSESECSLGFLQCAVDDLCFIRENPF